MALGIASVSANDLNSTDAVSQEDGEFDLAIDEADLVGDEIMGDDDKNVSGITYESKLDYTYGESGSLLVNVTGGTVNESDTVVVNHPEAVVLFANDTINVSGLAAGKYTLNVAVAPDENHTASTSAIDFTVNKANAAIKASKITVGHKKSTNWSIKVVDSNGKAMSNAKVILKIYTGSSFKTVNLKTNSKGVATYNTKSLAAGTHKVVMDLSDENYTAKLTSSINVVKQTALKFKLVKKQEDSTGALLSYLVLNKKTGKGINGIKVKVSIYTGKAYKTYTLKTKKVKNGKKTYNGALGFATNMFKAGTHKVTLVPVNFKYTGSVTTSLKITKAATKGTKFIRFL